MGLDAKGRNFSAPRLTPGKSSESLVYGSPNMLKDQARQIAIMDARARQYGFGGIKSVNSSTLNSGSSTATSLSSVPLGTPTGSGETSYTAKPITIDSNPNHSSTMANSARGYSSVQARAKNKTSGIIIAIVLLIAFGPMILMLLLATLSAIFEVLTY